ncbi:zinc-type alcohol dehydrogenase superfamily [Achaetomium macrosporum]|uniref:Zinc-type alcohol dehydrogenase superfamily n=1 Tax=Achaetomium macrosporum TaxID=79813 RepID=A0AAN7C8P5_9PEZI|nr:zinc-type alcohol dehydrogenase superfamily [Achaetomium macrosporum]
MSQKALVLEKLGAPLVLQARHIPEPKEHQILVKIIAVGLNPHDQKIRDYGLIITPDHLPYITGNDIAGVVEKVGPGVTAFHPGDRVFAQADTSTPDGGGVQQYALVPADLVAAIPKSMSFDEAATLPTVAMASFIALFHPSGLGLPPPYSKAIAPFNYHQRSLLIIGGGSNCGKLAIQFARLVGFGTTIALAAKTPEKEAELKELGATHVLDRYAEDVAEQCRSIVGDGLLYALDAVNMGPEGHALGVSLLSDSQKGTLVTLLPGGVDESKVGNKPAGYEVKFSQGSGHLHREMGQLFWQCLPGWLEAGKIRPLRYRTISGLDEKAVNEALDAYRDGAGVTKVNVHPHESS